MTVPGYRDSKNQAGEKSKYFYMQQNIDNTSWSMVHYIYVVGSSTTVGAPVPLPSPGGRTERIFP